jgi:DNA-binding GntR family transcriptional regulator
MDNQLPQASTLGDAIYHRLREDILHGHLRPNEMLVETELAERLHASRTPVRESLQRLAKDGLVASRNRRWFIVEPTLKDIGDIYDVRTALEAHAARLASERVTDQQIDDLFKALYSRGAAGPGMSDFVTSNEVFHTLIVDIADNPRLSAATEQSKRFYFNTQVAHFYTPDELATSHQQHKVLAEAIRDRDGDAADRITRVHIMHSYEIIREHWPS